MATRYINVRANNEADAKKFAKTHAKLSTMHHSPERVGSVKLNRKMGLAGGVKAYTVGLTKRKVERYKSGKKIHQLKPKYNR